MRLHIFLLAIRIRQQLLSSWVGGGRGGGEEVRLRGLRERQCKHAPQIHLMNAPEGDTLCQGAQPTDSKDLMPGLQGSHSLDGRRVMERNKNTTL